MLFSMHLSASLWTKVSKDHRLLARVTLRHGPGIGERGAVPALGRTLLSLATRGALTGLSWLCCREKHPFTSPSYLHQILCVRWAAQLPSL